MGKYRYFYTEKSSLGVRQAHENKSDLQGWSDPIEVIEVEALNKAMQFVYLAGFYAHRNNDSIIVKEVENFLKSLEGDV